MIAPDRAFEGVINQLQAEMAKATFDTWVKDTVFLGFDNSEFLIGAPNAYACDWLESRLTATITNQLKGLLSEELVEVRFVLHPSEDLFDDEFEEEGLLQGSPELRERGAAPAEAGLQRWYDHVHGVGAWHRGLRRDHQHQVFRVAPEG